MSYNTERPTMDELVARNASGISSMRESSLPVMVPIQEKDWDMMVNLLESTVSFQPKLYSLVKQQLAEKQMYSQQMLKQIKDSATQMGSLAQQAGKNLEKSLNDSLAKGSQLETAIAKAAKRRNWKTWALIVMVSILSSVLGAVLSALLMYALAALSDDDEDPEERRKRIKAQENGEALGALLGLAVGAISEISDENKDEFEHKFK